MAASAFLAKIVINSCENKKLFVIYYLPFRSIFRLFWNKNFLNKIFVIKNLQTFLVFLILKSCSWKSDFFNGSHIFFVAYHFSFLQTFFSWRTAVYSGRCWLYWIPEKWDPGPETSTDGRPGPATRDPKISRWDPRPIKWDLRSRTPKYSSETWDL